MGNNIVRGSAFVALPGRKCEKMKGQKAERSKKSFFSLCTGSQTGAKSSIFEHNTASASVPPSNKTLKDLVAKGHSSFNEENFVKFSPQSGSLTLENRSARLSLPLFLSPSWSRKPSRTQVSCNRSVASRPCYVFASVVVGLFLLDAL